MLELHGTGDGDRGNADRRRSGPPPGTAQRWGIEQRIDAASDTETSGTERIGRSRRSRQRHLRKRAGDGGSGHAETAHGVLISPTLQHEAQSPLQRHEHRHDRVHERTDEQISIVSMAGVSLLVGDDDGELVGIELLDQSEETTIRPPAPGSV